MSDSLRPVAYSMAWLAPWLLGCVMRAEYLFRPAGAAGARFNGQKGAGWVAAAPVGVSEVVGSFQRLATGCVAL